ncbi:MAG: VanZ family protein [Anaerolineales bacterium]
MRKRELPLFVRWVPSFVIMGAIFFFSSLPASRVPSFGEWDLLIKKAGHASGYALLGLAYFFALPPRLSSGFRWVLAMVMAILFALSDEFHQSFVQDRNSSIIDVGIDAIGAAIALAIAAFYSSNSNSKSSI